MDEKNRQQDGAVLSDSEGEIFGELAENSNDLIELSSRDGKLIYVNPIGRRMIGIERPTGTTLHSLTDFLTSEEIRRQKAIYNIVATEGKWVGERTFKNIQTGREFPVQQSIFTIGNSEDGEIKFFGSFVRNLSAEQLLLSSLSLFKNAADAAREGMLITRSEGGRNPTFYINPAFTQITGYTHAEIKDDCELLKIDADGNRLQGLQDAIQNQLSFEILVKSLRRNGTPFWNQMSLSPVFGADGNINHYVTIIKDVTRELDAHETLRLETERLRLVLASVQIGTWEWDLQTNKLIWDDQMYAIHAIDRSQFPDPLLWWQTCLSTDEIQTLIDQSEHGGNKIEPFKITCENGEIKYIRKMARMIRDSNGKISRLIGVSWDVSDDHKAREIIEGQRVQIEASARLAQLGEMAGGIAHEINNPLAIISGFNDRLRASLESGNIDLEEVKLCTERISKTIGRIAGIVKGLRVVAREGSSDPFEETTMSSLVNDTLGLCLERAKNRGVRIFAEGALDLQIECRIVQISQVLTNLISNAIHAVEKSTERWIRIKVENDGDFVVLFVSDSGPGVPEAIRGKIFQPFFTTKSAGEGTGLGLSISTSIVKDHLGTLSLDGKQPHTTFAIRLPKRHKQSTHVKAS